MAGKQVNHVKFLNLLMEIRSRELQLFWLQPERRLFDVQNKKRKKLFWNVERFPDPWASRSQRSEYYDVIAAATIRDLTQAYREMEHARVIHTLFWENYLGLNKQPISAQQHLPINPGWQAAARGTTPPLCHPPRVLSPQRALMKTGRKWGRTTRAGNDHIQIQESKEPKTESSESLRGGENG